MKTTLPSLTAFAFIFLTILARADVNDPQLPGHASRLRDSIRPKMEIIIGKFLSLGNSSPDSPGAISHDHADIEVISTLRSTLSGRFKAEYTTRILPQSYRELEPTIGIQYIMFINRRASDEYVIEKLLLATDQNIVSVKALIAAAPASK